MTAVLLATISEPVSVLGLALAVGIAAQWVGKRLGIPSIVFMLGAGLVCGPWLDLIDPDASFGPLLTPMIGLGVGLLLFQGGLTLEWSAIGSSTRHVVLRLLTMGTLTTLILATGAVRLLTDLPSSVAVLFGTIMVVTGPTVVIPLLRSARLRPRVANILQWEGIAVDPIGAVLGVVVLEVALKGSEGPGATLWAVARTSVIGVSVGVALAIALVIALHRHWVPDELRSPLTIVVAVGAYALGNGFADEAGLYATTAAGILLANQRKVPLRPIEDFAHTIEPLVLAVLFILLAARVQFDTLSSNLATAAILLVVLVVVVRPAAVFVSTIGSSITGRERAFLACLAPRGIVAASVSAVFGAALTEGGVAGGEDLAAITFLLVLGTVLVYGFAARPLARALRVDMPEPTGVVVVGSRPWARAFSSTLAGVGVPTLLVAEGDDAAEAAIADGLLVYRGRLDHQELAEAFDATGTRWVLVGSDQDALDETVAEVTARHLGSSRLWRVARDLGQHQHLDETAVEGRVAFRGLTQDDLDDALAKGGAFLHITAEERRDGDLGMVGLTADTVPELLAADDVWPGDRLVVLRHPAERETDDAVSDQTKTLDAADPEPEPHVAD